MLAEARTERGRKPRCRGFVTRRRQDLMQRTTHEAAFQAMIRPVMAERHARLGLRRLQSRFDEGGAQDRNFFRRVRHVARGAGEKIIGPILD